MTSLAESLAESVSMLRSRINETGAKVTVPDELGVVHADKSQCSQIFQNLLANALKYRRPDVAPHIHITAERRNGHVIVGVRDNGIGFDQKHAERIFGLFKRLHRHDEYPGTGLGLAIAKRIVERHGGKMWANGRPGSGAALLFHITRRPLTLTMRSQAIRANRIVREVWQPFGTNRRYCVRDPAVEPRLFAAFLSNNQVNGPEWHVPVLKCSIAHGCDAIKERLATHGLACYSSEQDVAPGVLAGTLF